MATGLSRYGRTRRSVALDYEMWSSTLEDIGSALLVNLDRVQETFRMFRKTLF